MFLGLDKKDAGTIAAIDSRGNRVSYGELVQYAIRFGCIVPKRMVVIILCRNDIPTLVTYLACMAQRIVPLLIGERTEKGTLEKFIQTYHPACVFGHREILEKMDILGFVRTMEGTDFGMVETGFQVEPLYEELSLLLTTSGSTGSPKLVRHSYFNLEEQAKNVSAFFHLDQTERPMVDLPIMYTYGLSVVNSHLYVGATLLLSDESIFSKKFWDFFRRNEATSFTGVPYSFEMLKKLRFFSMDLPSLRMLSQGGGKLSAELQKEFAQYIAGRGGKYIATYGQTECSARMSYLPPELALEKCGSIGKAIPGGRLYLMDDEGNVITDAYQEGEMYYEGPNVTLGYAESYRDLAKGDERGGVIATGDMAYIDKDGYFYITGRRKRFLKLFGYRVSLDECEKMIKEAFQIECACTGTDEKLIVCILDEKDKFAVKKFLLEKTNLYASTVDMRIVDEIPRNDAGKILYARLNERLVHWEGGSNA